MQVVLVLLSSLLESMNGSKCPILVRDAYAFLPMNHCKRLIRGANSRLTGFRWMIAYISSSKKRQVSSPSKFPKTAAYVEREEFASWLRHTASNFYSTGSERHVLIRSLLTFVSMLELGISQAAHLQLAACTPNLLPCGHCFMSTLRMKEHLTNFRHCVKNAVAYLPTSPGLGIYVREDKIKELEQARVTITLPRLQKSQEPIYPPLSQVE